MKREEDWLREACAGLAREEADQLERSLTRADLRQAEEVYRRHSRKALSLIRRGARKQSPARMTLRAAAVLLLLAGAAYLSLRQPPPDRIPQFHPSATAAPYYSPVPTLLPSPTAIQEYSPTPFAEPAEKSTETPTLAPISTPAPTFLPTLAPTAEPTPEPTPAPSAVPSPPEGWTGAHFPMGLLDAEKPDIAQGDGWQQASWDGWEFAEYTDDRVLTVPKGAEISYVQWEDIVALRASVRL